MYDPDAVTRSTHALAREVLDQVKVLESIQVALAKISEQAWPAGDLLCRDHQQELIRLHALQQRLRWACNQYASLAQDK